MQLSSGAFGVLYFSGVTRNVSEKAAEVISAVYGVKKSDAVNSEAVNIYVNDRKFDEEPAPKVFMTDKLVWMADAGTLSRIFGCEIERTDSHTALVKADGQTYCFSDGSPIVTTSGGDKLYDNAVLFDNDSVCCPSRPSVSFWAHHFYGMRTVIRLRLHYQQQRQERCRHILI